MIALTGIYISVTLLVALFSALMGLDGSVAPNDRTKAARVAFASPLWPFMLVWLLVLAVRDLCHVAKRRVE